MVLSKSLHEALLDACGVLGARPFDSAVASARTNAVLPATVEGERVLLRAELLMGMESTRERLRAVEHLRRQGVPWSRPIDVLEVPLFPGMLTVSVWEWIEYVPGRPLAHTVADALDTLHRASAPEGLTPRFGSVSETLARSEILAPWIERFREVEAYALRWPQECVVHGDALSTNLLHAADGVTFVDTDTLALGNPLTDWQYLARDARADPRRTHVEWSLTSTELENICGVAEPGWQLPKHPLWNAQRLIHLKRRVMLWERGGRLSEDLGHLRAIADTITPVP
jgi:hypothetical protein